MEHKPYDITELSEPFKAFIGNQALMQQFFDMLPIPIEIFAPDGVTIYVNRAGLEMTGCKDANLLVGKYNLLNDPVCIEICGQEAIESIFRGETVSYPDFPAPIQDVLDRGVIDEKPWIAATMDLSFLPIWNEGQFVCTVCFFFYKNIYRGRADIIKAQEYIQQNWLGKFDLEKAARAANLSPRHFQRIFKEVTDLTPHDYYRQTKVEKLKEKLLDPALSIEQAFNACGVDVHGAYFRFFKEMTDESPGEYRKRHGIK